MNYAQHNNQSFCALCNKEEPVLYAMVDSALQKTHKPFFVPDWMGRVDYEAAVVVRICRLGKAIPERFAHRYYDAATVGVDFTARDLLEQAQREGLPWTLSKGFDASAVIGEWMPLAELQDSGEAPGGGLSFRLDVNGTTVQQGSTGELRFGIDALIAYASRYFTLKTGDLLFTGTPAGAGPVAIGDHLEGWLGDRRVLDLDCK